MIEKTSGFFSNSKKYCVRQIVALFCRQANFFTLECTHLKRGTKVFKELCPSIGGGKRPD